MTTVSPVTSGIAIKNGGTPEGARQGTCNMLSVTEPRTAGNSAPSKSPELHVVSTAKKMGIWLDSLVEKSQTKPSSQIVSLTPVMAEALLDRNPANRRISEVLVENYAHEIRGGHWAFNGEPIIVSDTGELNDGQHRCRAVIEAGKAIDVILIVGIKRNTRTTLDQGRVRTIGDFLSMEGNTYTNVLGAAANIVWQYRMRGTVGSSGRARGTKGELLAFVSDNPGIVRSVALVHEKGADAAGGKTILAAAHFILSSISKEDADHFILSLIRGAGLRVGDPILYARNRLINERHLLRAPERLELLFKAWLAWRNRETVKRIWLNGTLPAMEG